VLGTKAAAPTALISFDSIFLCAIVPLLIELTIAIIRPCCTRLPWWDAKSR
jgi:hypothetical protein